VSFQAPKHIKQRYVRRLEPGAAALENLVEAIQTLLRVASMDDPLFLAHGLALLMKHMRADQAYFVTVQGGVLMTQWWLPERPDRQAPPQIPTLCEWLLENPHRILVLRNVPRDRRWHEDPDLKAEGIRAVAGVALHENGNVRGLVFLQFRKPHDFARAELALLATVANSLSRILEIENLKTALSDLEDFLAITKAVVEDSSIQDPVTGLPNMRYLEIWLQANLAAATREHEVMTVAEWDLDAENPEGQKRLKEITDRIRAGDLLVAMGHNHYLLVLPKMPKGLGQIFLLRLGQKLGGTAMGATLWIPEVDDLGLDSVRRRLKQAWQESHDHPAHELVWKLPASGYEG
jgi:hypothetical protein